MPKLRPTWPEAAVLADRFRRLGLQTIRAVEAHENRTVMVSLTSRRVLRLHRGYAFASDAVLRAIIRFVTPCTPLAERCRAEHELLAFPVTDFVPPRLRWPERPRPLAQDAQVLRRLARLRRRLNREHFRGLLPAVPIRLSGRMRTRLGELTLDDAGRLPVEIAISRRHVKRDLWSEVRQTLLHEMVHQWQAEMGLAVDHGPTFRRKARELGVEPTAWRTVRSRKRAARYS